LLPLKNARGVDFLCTYALARSSTSIAKTSTPHRYSPDNNNNNPGDLYYLGYKKILFKKNIKIIIIIIITAHGGLGVRRVSSLAIPAFLASAASTLPLQDDILSLCPCATGTFLDQYLSIWSSSAGPPPDPLPGKQSFWDKPGLLTDGALIESSLVEPSSRERDSWLRRRHTVVTGFLLCLFLTVAYASTTRQCE